MRLIEDIIPIAKMRQNIIFYNTGNGKNVGVLIQIAYLDVCTTIQ
jgi:hypothetical protein